MFLQTFVISGSSVRIVTLRNGPKLTAAQQLKKWGARRGAYAGKEHPILYSVYCSIWLLVITGATDGIGREFALQLAKAGFGVVLVSRNPEKLQKLANEISELPVRQRQPINASVQLRSTRSM
jgi:hypothetical protein